MKFPFHTTASEKRLVGDLLAIAEGRGCNPPGPESAATAAAYIEKLEIFLFPETAAIIRKREDVLASLKTPGLNVTFDRTLETPHLTIRAVIRNEREYREILARLNGFDFAAWQRHCDAERQYAD